MDRLLIIDDELKLGKFVAKVGSMAGYESVYTDQTEEFRRRLTEWNPSVVVIDLQMPNTDGIELLREMSEMKIPAKIFVCSGIDSRTVDTAMRLGGELGLSMAGTLDKPVRLAELRDALHRLKGGSTQTTKADLQRAIERDELFLVYQPKVDLRSGKIAGFEALVRWRLPNGSVLPPDQFLPIVEQEGMMDQLTGWVLDRAVARAKRWKEQGRETTLAVNISASNLHDQKLPDTIASLCRAAVVPSKSMTLELTETTTMSDAARMMEVLARFRIKDFLLSIDDFGTGYSSLVQLQRLPFSEIKIDKSFVMEMDRSRECAVIAKTVIDMGHNLGLSVCAEGVESAASLEMLKRFGCDFAQGFYFSKPVTACEVGQILSAPGVAAVRPRI